MFKVPQTNQAVKTKESGGMSVCSVCGSLEHSQFYCRMKPRSTFKVKLHCTRCDSLNHTHSQCPERLTDKINPETGRYPAVKRLRTAGKYSMRWMATKRAWHKANRPNHQGYYVCYICQKHIAEAEVTLDHIKSRSRYPELRFELTNLAPCCSGCNTLKGSKELEEI